MKPRNNFFQDPDGDLSMTRLILFIVIAATISNWTVANAFALLTAWQTKAAPYLVPLPAGMIELCGAVLGTKLWQNGQER